MANTSFTPGPWFAHDDHPQHACFHIAPADYFHDEVATVFSPGDEKAEADARLIAAAPELYDSLEWALRYVEQVFIEQGLPLKGSGEEIAHSNAYAVLAKVRGEPS